MPHRDGTFEHASRLHENVRNCRIVCASARGSAAAGESAAMPMLIPGRSRASYVVAMPLVDVTYGPQVAERDLQQLAKTLPHAVSLAGECPEEPYDRDLQPGDVEVRFHPEGRTTSPVSISWSRSARNGSQAAQKRGKNDATSCAKP